MVNVWTHMGHISVSALRPWFLHRTALAAFYPPRQVKTYISCNKVLCTWKPYNTQQNPYSLKPFTRKTLTLKPLKSHFKSHTLNFKSHCLNQCFPILEAPRTAHIGRLLLIHLIRSLVKFSMTWIQCVRLVRHLKSALLGFRKELDWATML